jgi:hypothetical protein
VIRIFFGGFVLACACLSAVAGGAPTDRQKILSMRFEWRSEGPAGLCGKMCGMWISAVGPITDSTPHDFEAFAKQKDVRGATLVLDSEGGSVVDTIALGHALRRLDITTTVGTTVIASASDGGRTTTLSPVADCESMCAFALLGGVRRYVPPEARVLVHQIWLSKKREHSETASYTVDDRNGGWHRASASGPAGAAMAAVVSALERRNSADGPQYHRSPVRCETQGRCDRRGAGSDLGECGGCCAVIAPRA